MKIQTVQNLFKYHCISEIFKIIKFRCPYPLYDSINVSKRDTSLTIILPEKTNTFLYRASQLWNTVHKRIVNTDTGLEVSVNLVKLRTKTTILECQAVEEKDFWTDKNFQILPTPHDIGATPLTLHSYPPNCNSSSIMIDIVTI